MATGTSSNTLDFSVVSYGVRVPASGNLAFTLPFTFSSTAFNPIVGAADVGISFGVSTSSSVATGAFDGDVFVPFILDATAIAPIKGALDQTVTFTTDTEVDVPNRGTVNTTLDFITDFQTGVLVSARGKPKTSFSTTGTGEVPVKGIFDKVFEIGLSSRMAQVSEFEGDTVVPFLLSSVAINDSTREYSRTGLNGLAFRNGNDGQNELNILNSLNGLRTTKSGENGVRIDDNNYTDLRTGVKIISRDYRNETLVRPSQGRLVKSY